MTNCTGIARLSGGHHEQSQGAIFLGDGGRRPPEPLQFETVHVPISPATGTFHGRGHALLVGVHEAEPTGECKA